MPLPLSITNTKLIQACLQSGKKATIAVENRVGTLRRPVAGSSFAIVLSFNHQASRRLPFRFSQRMRIQSQPPNEGRSIQSKF